MRAKLNFCFNSKFSRLYSAKEKSPSGLQIGFKKAEDFPNWYQQVLTKAELIEYYDVSGCYIMRPWAYRIWEFVQSWMDQELKKAGVENAYFPLLVTQEALSMEQNHIEGFTPEVAWVTKTGEKTLSQPLAIRPTSETIMYPAYAKWINSYRDLPLKINQWNNVVRWEFHKPVPFIRSREFLWQEGHSVFETKAEAEAEVLERLDMYKRCYEDLMAVPVIPGMKSDNEKFAANIDFVGADYTTTLELYLDGAQKALQGATSHHLGQKFSKIFKIEYLSKKHHLKEFAWQNSWGFTTRSIGAMLMVHGDDRGLVLPPKIAPIQVVIVPIYSKQGFADEITNRASEIKQRLEKIGVRVSIDDRNTVQPGFKFCHWELKGVPIRIDLGQRDLGPSLAASRRDKTKDEEGSLRKMEYSNLESEIEKLLNDIQSNLFEKASLKLENSLKVALNWNEFLDVLAEGKIALVEWCRNSECENTVKDRTQKLDLDVRSAKSLCIPFRYSEKPLQTHRCFACDQKSVAWTLFGRSY